MWFWDRLDKAGIVQDVCKSREIRSDTGQFGAGTWEYAEWSSRLRMVRRWPGGASGWRQVWEIYWRWGEYKMVICRLWRRCYKRAGIFWWAVIPKAGPRSLNWLRCGRQKLCEKRAELFLVPNARGTGNMSRPAAWAGWLYRRRERFRMCLWRYRPPVIMVSEIRIAKPICQGRNKAAGILYVIFMRVRDLGLKSNGRVRVNRVVRVVEPWGGRVIGLL